jgi:DNA-binding NtrC family response regulator
MPDAIKLLVVDDELDFLDTIGERLEAHGFEVTRASSGPDAIAAARHGGFDLALLDLKMPEMDGVELMKILREEHRFLQVIILTGYASIDAAVECTKAGASDFVSKSCDLDELLEKLKTAYGSRLTKKFAEDKLRLDEVNRLLSQEPMQIWIDARDQWAHRPGLITVLRQLWKVDDDEK